MLGTVPLEPSCLAYLTSHFILEKALMVTAAGNLGGGNYGAFCPTHPALGHVKERGGTTMWEPLAPRWALYGC